MERTSQYMEFSQFTTSCQLVQDNHKCIQLGMGAVYKGVTIGGLWSQVESTNHINYLEMLAAFLALQCFTKEICHPLTVYLHIVNTTAISYLNHKGWTASLSLCKLTKHIWQWHMSQNISLVSNHLLNSVAESKIAQDRQY